MRQVACSRLFWVCCLRGFVLRGEDCAAQMPCFRHSRNGDVQKAWSTGVELGVPMLLEIIRFIVGAFLLPLIGKLIAGFLQKITAMMLSGNKAAPMFSAS